MVANWTAPTVERIQPDRISDERTALEQWMDFQRSTLLMKCQGLTAEQLKARAVPPSSMSLLGLVRHMLEVERWWFRMNADGQDIGSLYCADDEEADFDNVDAADAAQNLRDFEAEVGQAKEAAARHELDEVVPSAGDHPDRTRSIRWIYIHMIEEYARHNGHADLLRERIDGVTGD